MIINYDYKNIKQNINLIFNRRKKSVRKQREHLYKLNYFLTYN